MTLSTKTCLPLFITVFAMAGPTGCSANNDPIRVVMETTMGDITIELYPDAAPKTVANFLEYADSGFYNGTIFHRVIPRFVIQGGGMRPGLQPKETRDPIENEADNGLKNERGTLSMARTAVVDSATSQFFINLADNAPLDHRDKSRQGYGYAVFARVVDGMDVVDSIAGVRTTNVGPYQDVPAEDVVIQNVRRVEQQ